MKLQGGKPYLARREAAKLRLEAQLVAGTKSTKDGTIPLSDADIKRIKAEIVSLEHMPSKKGKVVVGEAKVESVEYKWEDKK